MLFSYFLVGFAFFATHSAWCAAVEPKERYSLPISSNNAYGTGGNAAQAIPLSALIPPTLDQAYGPNAQTALSLDFAQQPDRWDPFNANNQSEFQWRYTGSSFTYPPADNAYVDLSGSSATPYQPYNYRKAALLSAPFQRWQPLTNDTNSTAPTVSAYDEGVLRWKSSAVIDPTQRIVLRFKSSCRVYNAEKHPFPAALVSHPDDDPRLATCFIYLETYTANVTSGIYILITNKSIWGVYETDATISKRRIGIRQSYNDIVDIGLEYNALSNQFVFYVSGQPTWIITQPGLSPPQDGVTKTDAYGSANSETAGTGGLEFSIRAGTHKCLDESDPWNQAGTERLVRISSDPAFYGNATFYDENDLRENNLWGQTVKMTLYSVVVQTASGAVQPTPVGQSSSTVYNNVVYN